MAFCEQGQTEGCEEKAAAPAPPRRSPTDVVPAKTIPDLDLVGNEPQGPVAERTRRDGLILQALRIPSLVGHFVWKGVQRGIDAINVPEVKRPSEVEVLAGLAAAALIAGTAGAASTWLVSGFEIASKVRNKLAESAVKDSVKLMLKTASTTTGEAKGHATDLKAAFFDACEQRLDDAAIGRALGIANLHNRLSMLNTDELEHLAHRVPQDLLGRSDSLKEVVANQTVVAWTNFLARARYGKGQRWDPWKPHGSSGAMRLRGAADPDHDDLSKTTAGNVDAQAVGFHGDAVSIIEGPELYGVLEVSIDTEGRIVKFPGWGMRLANAGPAVRTRIKRLGTVRELPVNKLVRICSQPTGPLPPKVEASIVITADGYLRQHNLGGGAKIHMPNTAPVGPARIREHHDCMQDLIAGRPSGECYVDTASNQQRAADLAEKAQDLPLSLLEV